ncbi:DUF2059 domain-containing protein [Pacificibacter sp. AS14]|uniref:DUF2059 domain-containing protein n=1 Tax=Pacificibacter sp. AS14 TaxID=3135785 RepID=UPI00316FB834
MSEGLIPLGGKVIDQEAFFYALQGDAPKTLAEDIHNHAIQLYAHSLAESDLAEVVAFYKTSTGRDHNALIRSPDTYKDGNASQVVDEWIESLTPSNQSYGKPLTWRKLRP